MKKLVVSAVMILSLVLTGAASAQSIYSTTCSSFTRDLSIGSQGSDVRSLQVFLVGQNYPGSGSWMETGYYGAATQAAVRDYQQLHGLPQTGVLDAATRASIASCGTQYTQTTQYNSYTYPYTSYPYQYQTQTYPYQYQNQYSYQFGAPTLSSLSPTTATAGSVVTIYGSGFDSSSNNVSVGGTLVSGVSSYNGTSLTFMVPYVTSSGTVSVYATNTRGTSNALALFVQTSVQCGTYPYNYGYNYNCGNCSTYGSCTSGALSLSSLSPNAVSQGVSVTIYGSGFDSSNNTVYVGGTALYNIASYNGTSMSFTVPYSTTGTVQVYVTNSRGTSNALSLSILGSNNQCGAYLYNYNCGNCYPYGSCNSGTLSLSALSPNSGAVGSAVTIYGSGFSTSGNSVHFGQGIITGLNSTDGQSLSFIVPSQLTGYGSANVYLGTYNVSVTNASGASSNSLPYTVTSLGSSGTPSITSVNGPTTLAVNQSGTWTLSITPNSNQYVTVSAAWGDTGNGYVNMAAPQQLYGSGTQTVSFTHAYITAGTYSVTFTVSNTNGQSTTYTATVNVTGSNSALSLSYLTPTSGRVGTQIAIVGSGFSTYDNTVHFGVGGTLHVPSYNGTTIYFTIPSYVSSCDVNPGTYCFAAQPVTPGTYQLYVTNSTGQTNQLTFTVTQ